MTRKRPAQIAKIEPGKLTPALNMLHVQDLVESLAATALATPIVVRPTEHKAGSPWTPTTGFHRVEVAKCDASRKP
jgi:ParB-like chromosome segregation protein Spo0J